MSVIRILPVVCDNCRADFVVNDDDPNTAVCPNGCPGETLDLTPPPAATGVVHLNYGSGHGEWIDLAVLDMMDGDTRMTISKGERDELRRVVRTDFKVLDREIGVREAELAAEIEQAIARRFEPSETALAAAQAQIAVLVT